MAFAEIIVVDDASDAPSHWPGNDRVRICRNARNLGYVRSVNRGMSVMQSEIILILDCDAYPLTDFVPTLRQRFGSEATLGALGGRVTNGSGHYGITGEAAPRLSSFIVGQALNAQLRPPEWTPTQDLVLHSYCMAVRAAAFRAMGGFDEEFDFLDADIDLSLRLQNSGWKIEIDPTLVCHHLGSGSPQSTVARVKRFHRNRLRLLQKHHMIGWKQGVLLLLTLRHLIEWVILLVGSLAPSRESRTYAEKRAGRVDLLRSVFREYR
jgi:GT2 family glycosyltransferase